MYDGLATHRFFVLGGGDNGPTVAFPRLREGVVLAAVADAGARLQQLRLQPERLRLEVHGVDHVHVAGDGKYLANRPTGPQGQCSE